MNTSRTHSFASNMFGKKIIARKAICTLDNGYKYQATFYFPPDEGRVPRGDRAQVGGGFQQVSAQHGP